MMSKTATSAVNGEILPATLDRRILPRASRQPRPDSHVLALEELRVRGLERSVVLGTGLLVAAGLTWAALAHVPEVAVSVGEITPTEAPAPVQHLEGGIVAEVLVNEGEAIEAGQPLLRMNDAVAQAELSQARHRLDSLQLQAQRLAAAAEGNVIVLDLRGRQGQTAGSSPMRVAMRRRCRL